MEIGVFWILFSLLAFSRFHLSLNLPLLMCGFWGIYLLSTSIVVLYLFSFWNEGSPFKSSIVFEREMAEALVKICVLHSF